MSRYYSNKKWVDKEYHSGQKKLVNQQHSDALNVILRNLQMLNTNPMKKNLAGERERERVEDKDGFEHACKKLLSLVLTLRGVLYISLPLYYTNCCNSLFVKHRLHVFFSETVFLLTSPATRQDRASYQVFTQVS